MQSFLAALRLRRELAAVALLLVCQPFGRLHAQRETTSDMADFEHRAMLSKQLGATHMLVSEGLPLATWQIGPNDPYPAWFVHHAGILTIFPPAAVVPYVNKQYAAEVSSVLQKRCAVLEKYGLKGVWNANEPEVMPEAFFTAHPEFRGPRIDQPNRSRKVYFAPNVDDPEMLRIYRQSVQLLLKTCPQVEQFNWVTTDAGSGFDWSPGLYPGANGNSKYRDRPMADRVSGFLINVQEAAKEAGHTVQVNLRPIEARQWMLPTFPPDVMENTVRKLPRGLAVDGHEGPDGRPFAGVATVRSGGRAFYPVVGLAVPPMGSGAGSIWGNSNGKVLDKFMVDFGDAASVEMNNRLFQATRSGDMHTLLLRMRALRAFAVREVGEAQADNLMEVWAALNDAQMELQVLNFGDVLRMGHVLNRWVTRPMVPFPEQLTEAEQKDYRRFLFQAKGEEEAGNLVDIQAMRMYEGWGAKLLFQRTIEVTVPRLQKAVRLVADLHDTTNTDAARAQWELMRVRLEAVIDLLHSADNMVAYQAQLDRVKTLAAKVELDPVLGAQSSWDRTDLMETAREEIDTMVDLQRLLTTAKGPVLDTAATPESETIMRLGPNVAAELKHKIDVMNAHWRDYDLLFTKPNP